MRRRLLDLLCGRSLDRDRVGEALSLVRESGAIDVCRDHSTRLFEKAWSQFTALVQDSEKKTMLRDLCDMLIGIPNGE